MRNFNVAEPRTGGPRFDLALIAGFFVFYGVFIAVALHEEHSPRSESVFADRDPAGYRACTALEQSGFPDARRDAAASGEQAIREAADEARLRAACTDAGMAFRR